MGLVWVKYGFSTGSKKTNPGFRNRTRYLTFYKNWGLEITPLFFKDLNILIYNNLLIYKNKIYIYILVYRNNYFKISIYLLN